MATPRSAASTLSTTRSSSIRIAAARFLEAGDDAQQGRLAAAGRTDEDDELALIDFEVDVLEHLDGAELLADVPEGEAWCAHRPSYLMPVEAMPEAM